MTISILKAVSFLILFPFVIAVLMFCIRNSSLLRNFVAIVGGFSVMATAIMVGIRVLSMKGTTHNTYLTATAPHDHIIMGGEILLMCVVIFLSIKYKNYYAIILSMIGTIPVLAMDL